MWNVESAQNSIPHIPHIPMVETARKVLQSSGVSWILILRAFFRQFFPEKNLYIFYLASPEDFIHLRGGMGDCKHKFCGILGMCGMLRQRGIAIHTFRPQNGPKCAEIVWSDLNTISGEEFLECVECWVSAAQHSTHSTHSDARNSPKGAEIVWYELNMNIEGFFQAFFSWKKPLYILFGFARRFYSP